MLRRLFAVLLLVRDHDFRPVRHFASFVFQGDWTACAARSDFIARARQLAHHTYVLARAFLIYMRIGHAVRAEMSGYGWCR